MMARQAIAGIGSLFWIACLLGGTGVAADESPPFYRDKQITILIGYPPGGGYDAYARLLGRYLGQHIPGAPKVVPSNMPGAGSMIVANHLYNRASNDGTIIGMFAGGMALSPLFGEKNALFDARKLTWLGSMNEETSICLSWGTSGVDSIDDVLKSPFTIGTSSATGTSYTFPIAANNLLGTKFKLVAGYHGSSGVMLAVERGEVQGMCGLQLSTLETSRPQWLEKKQVNLLLQQTTHRNRDLPDVPTVMDLAKSDDVRRIIDLIYGWQIMGRPFAAPPGLGRDKIDILRHAFDASMKDPQLLAEAKKLHLDIEPISGSHIDQFIAQAYATPKPLIERAIQAQGRATVE